MHSAPPAQSSERLDLEQQAAASEGLLVHAAAIGILFALLVLLMTVQQITDWWTRRDRPRRDEQEVIAQPQALGRPVGRSAGSGRRPGD